LSRPDEEPAEATAAAGPSRSLLVAFGVVALVSLLPLPWRHIARALDL